MIVKTKKVYYCGFCKKHGLSASCINRHEKSCTANPDRICRLCGKDSIKDLIQKYQDSYKIIKIEGGFVGQTIKIEWKDGKGIKAEDILNDVACCPNCALTIMRVCKLNHYPIDFKFDYQGLLKNWWADKNAEEYDKEICGAAPY